MTLEQATPEEAVEQYIASKRLESAQTTVSNHRYRLGTFLEWADENGFHDMRELSGMDCERFKNWKMNRGNINKVTLKNHLHTFRQFVKYCENVETVEEGVADKVMIPILEDGEDARSVYLTHERASTILDYLQKFAYASKEHLVFGILYNTGMRRSALHSLDVDDWNSKERYLTVRHRAEEGTVLKNREEGERNVTISSASLAEAIDDYIETERHDVRDDFEREPLLTSTQGRLHSKTLQKTVYKVTRPCWYGEECPHDRNPDDCEGADYKGYSKCPSSVSPHPIRRSAITHHLNADVPMQIVSERTDVSPEVLEKHYREQNQEERRNSREKYLGNI